MASVGELMQKHAVGVAATAKVSNAVRLMKAAHVSLMPVVEGGRLVGLVTKEVASISGNSTRLVSEVMLKPDLFVEEGMNIEAAADLMIRRHASRVPVINNRNQMLFLGIVTASDIVKEMKK